MDERYMIATLEIDFGLFGEDCSAGRIPMPVRGAQEKAAGLALLHRFRRVMLRFRNRSITIGISLAKPSGLHRGEFALRELARSEEHTSELQSLMRISYAVFCLKKKKYNNIITH